MEFSILQEAILRLSTKTFPTSEWVYFSYRHNGQVYHVSLYLRKKFKSNSDFFTIANILIDSTSSGLGSKIIDFIEKFIIENKLFGGINFESVVNDRFLNYLLNRNYSNRLYLSEDQTQLYKIA